MALGSDLRTDKKIDTNQGFWVIRRALEYMCAGRVILGKNKILEERTADVNRVLVERKTNDDEVEHEDGTGTRGKFDNLVPPIADRCCTFRRLKNMDGR